MHMECDRVLCWHFQAEQVWDYCSKKLKYSTEAAKDLDSGLSHSAGNEFGSSLSVKRTIQKAISDLPSKEKIIVLECLKDRKFPLQVLNDEQRILLDECQNLFSGWAGIPRRYLRGKSGTRQVLETASDSDPASEPSEEASDIDYPSPYDLDYPSPLDLDYPSVEMKKFTPMASQDSANDNRMYLVGAVIASSMAGIALAALVLFLCVNKDRRDDEPKDVQRDDKPLLNFNGTDSPGIVEPWSCFLS